ncbi:wd-40 repeat-containing protein [Moniliophthora roreri]|nr:wd-40 repeat-containing protein [Moniliophthora roreri]
MVTTLRKHDPLPPSLPPNPSPPRSSSGYNWDTLIPDSETPRLPSPLPGHPKQKGGEAGCIQIPSLVGTHGPCSSTTDRKAGHLALSMDGRLLAVSERHGSEIFIYDTGSLRLRHRLNSRHGMGNIGGMVFGVKNKLVVSSHSGGLMGKSLIRVLDLDKQFSHNVETVKNRTYEAYGDILASSEHMPQISAEYLEDLVSTLVWETVLQGEVDLGSAFEGFFNKRPNRDQGSGNGPLSTNGKYLISLFYPGPKTTIVDIDVDNFVPQPLFSLPLDAQQYGKDVAAHFTNASSPEQSFIATISQEDKELRQLRIYDAATGQIEHVFPLPDDISWEQALIWSRNGIAFSPDGKLAGIHNSGLDPDFRVWHVENGTVLYSFPSKKSVFKNFISFTADGEFVYTWSVDTFYDDAHIRMYRTSTGELIQDWSPRDAVDRATDYTLDPKSVARNSRIASTQQGINGMVICTLQDGSIALYDARTNREGLIPSSKFENENRPKPKQSNTTTAAHVEVFITEDAEVVVAPDGKTIYSANTDGSVRVWTLD